MKTEEVTTADVATHTPKLLPPQSHDNWQLFTVEPDVFRKFETGRNKFERWSKYLNLEDENHRSIYDYAKSSNGKKTIVLQCGETGALRSIRRRAANEN